VPDLTAREEQGTEHKQKTPFLYELIDILQQKLLAMPRVIKEEMISLRAAHK
jgi:hypothetical protein